MYDKYNPYLYGAVDSDKYPNEPSVIENYQATIDYFIQNSADTKTRLMASGGYISAEEKATEDREFSDYSVKSLNFAINGGGTVDHTLVWGLRDLDED